METGCPASDLLSIAPLFNSQGHPIGPPRVWIPCKVPPSVEPGPLLLSSAVPPSQGGPAAGLAMSRSLGDCCGKDSGLSAEPEVETFPLHAEHDEVIVIASDGLWDMVSNEEAAEIALRSATPYAAANALRGFAIQRWHEEESIVVDDVTVCVIVYGV
jgi:serine/threonine protein phosphatase PrpC